MSDEEERTVDAAAPAQKPVDVPGAGARRYPETVFDRFHNRRVMVQLFEPYVAQITPEGPLATPLLEGRFAVVRPEGAEDNRQLEFLICNEGRDPNTNAPRQTWVLVRPGDVKHITLQEERVTQ